jgi:hypothetical protein
MSINNFELLKKFLNFDVKDTFYHIQIIQRKKDRDTLPEGLLCVGSNNSSRMIKSYSIYSLEHLERYEKEIILLCDTFVARACISLKRKDSEMIAHDISILISENIKNKNYSRIPSAYDSICSSHKGVDKIWLLDINTKDNNVLKEVNEYLLLLTPVGSKVILTVPSKSGYHLITSRFDSKSFANKHPSISIHKEVLTNLYIP